MAGAIEARLRELGLELPPTGTPAGNYMPHVVTGDLVFLSGQIPLEGGERRFVGKLGAAYEIADGQAAARLCAVNLIARLKAACDGDLDHVRRCVKIGGFVNCTPDFTAHPAVIDGASNLLVEVFGDKGRHARFAVGVAALPFDVAVELDGVFEIG